MILCRNCRRVWPKGTRYCGICRAGLGVRYCPESHASPLDARCCTECGSPALTKGVPASNLRAPVGCVVAVIAAVALPPILWALANALFAAAGNLAARLLPLAILAYAMSVVARKVFGDAVVSGALGILAAACRLLARLLGLALPEKAKSD